MKIQIIKEITLGPRQLTFGFDDNPAKDQKLVISSIYDQFEKCGQVILDKFIDHVMELHGLTEIDTLQYIFWSAHELKVHFRVDAKNRPPFEVKQILLNAPEKCVEIITNKLAEESVFNDITSFYDKLFDRKPHHNFTDQYEFACILLSDLKKWKSKLDSFRSIVQKPFFPGEELISDHLQSLTSLMAKQDSYSLIYTCCNHKEKISIIAEDVERLSSFYPRQIKFWDLLIQSIEEFRENLPEMKKNSDIFSKFNRLTQILASSFPYNLIQEAEGLLKQVKKYNNLIIQKATEAHRIKAISKINAMIEELTVLFNRCNTGQAVRNNYLYALRKAKKHLSHSKDIKQINLLLGDIEDMFDDFLEEL